MIENMNIWGFKRAPPMGPIKKGASLLPKGAVIAMCQFRVQTSLEPLFLRVRLCLIFEAKISVFKRG